MKAPPSSFKAHFDSVIVYVTEWIDSFRFWFESFQQSSSHRTHRMNLYCELKETQVFSIDSQQKNSIIDE